MARFLSHLLAQRSEKPSCLPDPQACHPARFLTASHAEDDNILIPSVTHLYRGRSSCILTQSRTNSRHGYTWEDWPVPLLFVC